MKYCPSEKPPVNLLTQALPKAQFESERLAVERLLIPFP
jgi:hypothetical protein